MISKENFIKYIAKIKELNDIFDAINKAGEKLEFFTVICSEHEQLIIDILEDTFDDKENGWIEYFLLDLEFGVKWRKDMITINGEDVPMSNAEELYKVLIDNINNRGE